MTGPTLSGGHYRLGEPLDAGSVEGGSGVRRAHDAWEDRGVLAVPLPTADGTPPAASVLTRVARDLRRAERAGHPGLVPALDVAVDTARGLWLMHAPPVGARSLATVRANGPAGPETVLGWALDLAGALVAAHTARLVHGRLAPDLVLVDPDGTAHLLAAPSGLRPDDRPEAEDADARALAAALLTSLAPPGDATDLAARLSALLDAVAEGGTPPTGSVEDAAGAVTPALDAALRRLARDVASVDAERGGTRDAATATVVTTAAAVGDDARRTTVVRTGDVAPTDGRTAAVDTSAVAPARTTRVATPPGTVAFGVAPPGSPWASPGRPVPGRGGSGAPWSGPTGTFGAPGPAGPASPGRRSRRPDRTLVVALAIVVALLLCAAVVLLGVLLRGDAGTPVPAPAPTTVPSVTDPGGRIVPAAAVTRLAERDDSRERDRRGGLEMRPSHPSTDGRTPW